MEHINDVATIQSAQAGDEKAMEKIIVSNLGLVKSIAQRFTGRGAEFEDLVQIGAMGMIKAVNNFDISLNLAFTTYAVPMIMGEIRRFFRDDGLLKVSRSAKSNAAKIFAFTQKFRSEHPRDPTVKEIAAGTGISEEDVVFALEASQPVLSLFEKNEEDDFKLENILGEDEIEKAFDNIALYEALKSLTPTEEKLIRLRYFKRLTQAQTAKLMGVSQVKISRDEKKICQKLKEQLLA